MPIRIPFFVPDQKNIEEQLKQEAKMKIARRNASACAGELITIGAKMIAAKERMKQSVFPCVAEHLPNVHNRIQKCYAEVLIVAEQVRIVFGSHA